MKMTKMIYPLVFALAVTMASTGCKHKPGKVTNIPGQRQGQVGDNDNSRTLPFGNPLPPENLANANGNIPVADSSMFDNMIEDRAALAAYTVRFAFDSAVIKSSEKSNLEAVAAALKSDTSAKLLIEGNCDERGTEEYNRSLGERRALAAREALAKEGVDSSRIRTISFGKDKPADTGHDESAWAKNRRDDFVLLHPKP